MFRFDPKDGRIHGEAPCPGCGATVQLVVSPDDRARWCCLACGTIGMAPFEFEPSRFSESEEDEAAEVDLAS